MSLKIVSRILGRDTISDEVEQVHINSDKDDIECLQVEVGNWTSLAFHELSGLIRLSPQSLVEFNHL